MSAPTQSGPAVPATEASPPSLAALMEDGSTCTPSTVRMIANKVRGHRWVSEEMANRLGAAALVDDTGAILAILQDVLERNVGDIDIVGVFARLRVYTLVHRRIGWDELDAAIAETCRYRSQLKPQMAAPHRHPRLIEAIVGHAMRSRGL